MSNRSCTSRQPGSRYCRSNATPMPSYFYVRCSHPFVSPNRSHRPSIHVDLFAWRLKTAAKPKCSPITTHGRPNLIVLGSRRTTGCVYPPGNNNNKTQLKPHRRPQPPGLPLRKSLLCRQPLELDQQRQLIKFRSLTKTTILAMVVRMRSSTWLKSSNITAIRI